MMNDIICNVCGEWGCGEGEVCTNCITKERWAIAVTVGDEVFNRTVEAANRSEAVASVMQEFPDDACVCSAHNVTNRKGFKSVFTLGN